MRDWRWWRVCALLVVSALLSGCFTDEPAAQHALHSQGITDIHFTGYDMWACGEDDFSSTGFTGTNALGEKVRGTVCCGWIAKSCTVRW